MVFSFSLFFLILPNSNTDGGPEQPDNGPPLTPERPRWRKCHPDWRRPATGAVKTDALVLSALVIHPDDKARLGQTCPGLQRELVRQSARKLRRNVLQIRSLRDLRVVGTKGTQTPKKPTKPEVIQQALERLHSTYQPLPLDVALQAN